MKERIQLNHSEFEDREDGNNELPEVDSNNNINTNTPSKNIIPTLYKNKRYNILPNRDCYVQLNIMR